MMRRLLVTVAIAGITVLAAWLAMTWADAGAPSLTDIVHQHPALSVLSGLLTPLLFLIPAIRARRKR